MKVVEYGEKQPQVVLLLHGGGLSWWSYREVAHRLQAHYHVVLPVLDGHAESGVPFVSIEENAARLICYIEERFGGAVLAAAGLLWAVRFLLKCWPKESGFANMRCLKAHWLSRCG